MPPKAVTITTKDFAGVPPVVEEVHIDLQAWCP
jgi:hypothetical protein